MEPCPNDFPSLLASTRLGKASQQPMLQHCAEVATQRPPGKDHEIAIVGEFGPITMNTQWETQIIPVLFKRHGVID